MYKSATVLLLAIACLSGCNKKSATAKGGDAVEQKLQELAGSKATNCGRVAVGGDLKGPGDCATQAAQSKKPFYVAYDLPGMTVAVAGAADGKLYSVQSQAAENQPGGAAAAPQVTATPCPAELRLAQSGRVTCFAPGSFGMGGSSPHGGGGMMMPPGSGENPHGGMSMPPATGENPHGGMSMPPATGENPHGAAKPAPNK